MDKRKAIINITTSVIFKLIILVVSIFARRYLVNILGTEATGIYSLYISIIGFLSIAELNSIDRTRGIKKDYLLQ